MRLKNPNAVSDDVFGAARADRQADTLAWEREIDERVYRLYGLTKDEIELVEAGKAEG